MTRKCHICPTNQEFTANHVLGHRHRHWVNSLPEEFWLMTEKQLRDYQKHDTKKEKRYRSKRLSP